MHDTLHQRFAELGFGILRHLRTPDESARRRPGIADDDAWQYVRIPPFLTDVDKLKNCKALRRLGDKTQVATGWPNRHIRTRRVHTDEVKSLAALAASLLGLNEDLCQAMALGHDIGHCPMGHEGERFLSEVLGRPFAHEIFSVIIAQHIERKGHGLGLTHQTLSGILHHSRKGGQMSALSDMSQEAILLMYSDKIAYTWSDFNDFTRVGATIPPVLEKAAHWFGKNQRERMRICLEALCVESAENGRVSFELSEAAERFGEFRKLMYRVYPTINFTAERGNRPFERVYEFCTAVGKAHDIHAAVLFALLCDRELLALSEKHRPDEHDLKETSLLEIIPHLSGRGINPTDPDMDW